MYHAVEALLIVPTFPASFERQLTVYNGLILIRNLRLSKSPDVLLQYFDILARSALLYFKELKVIHTQKVLAMFIEHVHLPRLRLTIQA